MDLSRRYVCFFVFLGVFLLEKVLPCELPSGIRTKCRDVSSNEDCPKTCCFDSSKSPNCYFQEKDYGPIQHSNGLCINVQTDGSDILIWSANCTSRNAFFLVSYDHPPYHVATGKCVLPSASIGDPGNADLVLKTGRECKGKIGTYRPTANGNLKYFHGTTAYDICIGSESAISTEPHENENVSIQKSVCDKNNSCKLSYVYERKIFEGHSADFQCESCSTNTIEIIWANYGVEVQRQYPFAISTSETDCVTTEATSVMQEKCNGKRSCSFAVNNSDFLTPNCRKNTILLVRYKCNSKFPAAPNMLNIKVRSQNELEVVWSNDNKNGGVTNFQICWNKAAGGTNEECCDDDIAFPEPKKSRRISGLEKATKYIITVARYNSDGKTPGRKRQEIAITRSAPLQASGIKSTSFQIVLGALQSDDKYIQIIVSKLQSDTKPTEHPENGLLPYGENTDNQPYIAAQLDGTNINQNSVFIVGDGKKYAPSSTRKRRTTNYQNVQLEPETYYSVFQRTFKNADLYYDSDWMNVIKTDDLPTKASSAPLTNMPEVTTEGTIIKQSGGGKGPSNDDPDDGSSGGDSSGGSSTAIIGAAAGGAVLLIILVIFVIIFIRRRRRENKSSDTHLYDKPVKYKTSKNKETVNEEQTHQNNPPSSDERDENPNVFTAPSGDVYAKPIKKKPTPDSECQNGLQNDTYANMQADISADVDERDGVKISRFLFYVEEMKKNKNFGFEKEFNELPVGQTHPWVVGRRAENANKNKYKNNAAYDHSRVVLSGEDYINANFIQGINSEVYIAAQGPVEETVNDFWQMIWEQDCTCIIALTNLVELGKVKCFKYWPDGETSYGEIHVKTVKTELFADYVLRYLDIKKDGKGKKIAQYHFISWPDHGVPKYPTKLLAFRHRFRALHTVSAQPIVVHCSAGIGRTGTFIALDMTLLRLIQLNEQTININETVNELRNQRVNMVQTLEQYILVHNAVLETVLCGFTEIVAENLKTEFERLEQKELNKSFTGFEIEFNKLSSVCHPFAPEECMAALLQKNKSKNRDSKIYPTENLRVYLCGSKEDEDPYINATYVHSYTQARAYIATQAPLPNTINDFWQMVFEKKTVVVVMLNNMSEEKTIYPQYWPDDFNEEQKYGDLFVKMVSAETRGPIISRKFVITNKNLKAAVTEHVVRHVQFTDWPEHGVPGNHNDVMDLLDSVEEAQQRSANGAVIVHCSNGAHRTGTYLTLAIQRERLSSEHVIDIFRCIKMLREQRPQFVGNLDQYKFCYDVMLTFVESFTTYDNIPKVQKE